MEKGCVGVEALAVPKGYRVQYKVIVQMPTIQVGGNHHLKPLTPEFIRKLHTDLMGLIRRHLPRRKRLVGVICNAPASLSKVLFDGIHLCCRRVREAGQPGYIGFCVRFLFVDDVLESEINQCQCEKITKACSCVCNSFLISTVAVISNVTLNMLNKRAKRMDDDCTL